MKSIVNDFSVIGLLLTLVVMIVVIGYQRFTNIDMTETRLFFTFWKTYAGFFCVYLVFAVLHYFTKSK